MPETRTATQVCASQEAPIFKVLGEINKETGLLHEMIGRLEARLGHVLQPAPPEVEAKPGGESLPMPSSAVMLKLSHVRATIARTVGSLQDLIERVDI